MEGLNLTIKPLLESLTNLVVFLICFGYDHLRTLTSREDLQKCLNVVKENAFQVSAYPVVLTLEDHLTPILQKKVAKVRF